MVFGVGLFDDFHRLGPKVKFLFQVIGASVAFWGGLRIEVFSFFGIHLHFVTLSYFVTVFWFVFFINAINLIDGLDGLAAGIAFFASAVLVILSVLRGEYLIAMLFAALAGPCLASCDITSTLPLSSWGTAGAISWDMLLPVFQSWVLSRATWGLPC
jgi:UDP-GlcNAc:undecaprenyl-phosphate GlcNAc-1-phosphate transferase